MGKIGVRIPVGAEHVALRNGFTGGPARARSQWNNEPRVGYYHWTGFPTF